MQPVKPAAWSASKPLAITANRARCAAAPPTTRSSLLSLARPASERAAACARGLFGGGDDNRGLMAVTPVATMHQPKP